jgi:DNA-binding SARP family transcriptional activator
LAGLLHLRLLGEFSARHDDGAQIPIRSKKARGLLAFLALAGQQGVSREKVIGLLWGERYHEQAQASLRQTLGEIRRDLNGLCESVLIADRRTIAIARQHVKVDTDSFWRLSASDDVGRLSEALSFYRGSLLDGLNIAEPTFEDWLRGERTRYDEHYRATLRRLLSQHLGRGDRNAAVDCCKQLLATDPTDEHGHRALMQCYAADGHRAHALRQYQICADALREEFQTAPSAETTALYEAIKLGGPAGTAPRHVTSVRAQDNSAEHAPENSADNAGGPFAGPSVQILPFTTHGGDGEELWLAGELANDVTAALGRFRWMSVIASHNEDTPRLFSRWLSGEDTAPAARFLLRGRFWRLSGTLRVTMELVDKQSGKTIWGEPFESVVDASGKFAPLLVSQIAGRTEARIRIHAAKTVRTKPVDRLDCFESTVGALYLIDEMSEDSFAQAAMLFERAKRLAPGFALPYSWQALWKIFCIGQGWSARSEVAPNTPHELAREAIRLDPEDAIALAIAGHFEAFIFHQFEQAQDLFDRALGFNPHCSFAWMLSAATQSYIGNPAEALKRLDWANEICPTDSQLKFMYNTARCIAHSFGRQPEKAAIWGRRAVRESPGFSNAFKLLLMNLGHLQRRDEAEPLLRRLLQLEPGFSLAQFAREYPMARPSDRAYFLEGLTLAGLN